MKHLPCKLAVLPAIVLVSSFSFAAGAQAAAPDAAKAPAKFDAGVISGLSARNIGSAAMSGRISALAAVPEKDGKLTVYVGAASGGIWKSSDGGTTYKPVFDKQAVQSIGDIAIDPSNHETIWAGTGESWTRNSVSIGDGIYKSTDGGESWTNMGLKGSEHIAKILIDPKDSNTVYACAPGKLWSDSSDRGLYKTSDGGKSWKLVLSGKNLSTGCASISMDPKDPNVIFAGMWDFRRKGWTFRSGGESPTAPSGSGLFRSANGGQSWTEVTAAANQGFPKQPFGRIAVTVAPSNPAIVYALVESPDSALYRSDDGGKTWQQRDKSQLMVWRPFYFASLIVDPNNPDRLFKPDLRLIQSLDGGKSFSNVGGGAHGDSHVLWIDPRNTQSSIVGDDGGLWYSTDGGNKWWKGNNLPVSQYYHVSVDDADPYRVYGGVQDNACWVGDSAYPGGIANQQWTNYCGGDGFWMFADPADADYIYMETQGGSITRVNRHTHEARDIQPKPNYHEKLRWNWNTPIALSPNEKGTIYMGAQFLFRSRDHGQSWERISPDLTTNDPKKQEQEKSGGVTVDNSAAETYTTIYSISESPKQAGLIWVGTDDGNLQLTRDGGKSWTKVGGNIKGQPAGTWVSWVEASPYEAGTAFAAFDRHSFGDMNPYIYKTTDYGKSWTPLVTGQDSKGLRGYVHVIRQDPLKPNLLFAGTEFGLWISIDGGAHWAEFKGGDFPAVAVRDIAIQPRDGDLVLATHGRGIWIVDDITPLRALDPKVLGSEAMFLPSRPIQQRIDAFGGWPGGDAGFVGPNPPEGAAITYYQRDRHLFGKLKIEVLDSKGNLVDSIPASVRRGINRVEWSMQTKAPRVPPAAQIAGNSIQGPRVPPGTYTVRMTKGKDVFETQLEVGLDRRDKFSVADRQAQFDASNRVKQLFGDMSDLVGKINAVRHDAEAEAATLPAQDATRKQLDELGDKANDIRKKIVATTEGGAITGELRLREHTDELYGAIMSYEGKPSDYQLASIDALKRELGDVQKAFADFTANDLSKTNAALGAKHLKQITVPETMPEEEGAAGGGKAALEAAMRGQEQERD
ncbi:WD40/YVTN/BNR-like repeat-containing protein [Dyella sp. Tek66A03]|uniref:WD40/YVTN/BNR-like repeat-containing protein n=1 Tax=Dyella sp. Tek66A03 TaxID=3458298 RepID=UPI00403EB55C